MIDGCNLKNKIDLTGYDYLSDIERRIFLSSLNKEQFELLNEVIWGSLTISFLELSENLECSLDEVAKVVEQLESCSLFTVNGNKLVVNKEMRRLFEIELARFEEDFEVSLNWIKQLFCRVPKDLFLHWYVIPRSADDIFESIIQRYAATPKTYERYLLELQFEDPLFNKIVKALNDSPDRVLPLSELRTLTGLEEKELHEYILHLEFNLVAFFSIRDFEPVITPFYEWNEYLRKKGELIPHVVDRDVPPQFAPFQLIEEISKALESILHCDLDEPLSSELIKLLIALELVEAHGNELQLTIEGRVWLEKNVNERAIYFLRHPHTKSGYHPLVEGDLRVRELELSLDVIDHGKWVPFQSFLKSIKVPLKNHSPVSLVKKGVKWSYQLPQYGQEEEEAVSEVVKNRLVKGGIVEMGGSEEEPLVRLTTFGKQYIS